jgi:hypothetical protein
MTGVATHPPPGNDDSHVWAGRIADFHPRATQRDRPECRTHGRREAADVAAQRPHREPHSCNKRGPDGRRTRSRGVSSDRLASPRRTTEWRVNERLDARYQAFGMDCNEQSNDTLSQRDQAAAPGETSPAMLRRHGTTWFRVGTGIRPRSTRHPQRALTSTGQGTTPDVPYRFIQSGRCRAKAVGRSEVSARGRPSRARRSAR